MKTLKINLDKIEKELRRLKLNKYRLSLRMKVPHSYVYGLFTPANKDINHTFRIVERIADALDKMDPKDLIV